MPSALRQRASAALARPRARANIRRAMDGLVAKRLAVFPDEEELERLRDQGQAIRDEALARLPQLLEQLEQRAQANGIAVHWAADAAAANAIIAGLIQAAGASAVLKGKSMVSEEIGLNAHLAGLGISAIETDLGELILQLAHEHPSHIVAPAVHKDRAEVAVLFARAFPELLPADFDPATVSIETLTALARQVMRTRFRDTPVGLSGVNFAVAETGTLCLVENEGNGRMSTSVPAVHIAVTGIEKVIPRLADLAPLLTLLTRSATGQPITTYVNLISGPRRGDERDGPCAVHLVLLDNGRSRIHADPELRATLRCIRCGACMNHCPVYTRIGGHGYGTVYPGPIGAILEPQLQGLARQGELAQASTLCGACAEVCPVRIPIPALLNRLRHAQAEGPWTGPDPAAAGRDWRQALLWRLWALIYSSPWRYRWLSLALTRLRGPLGLLAGRGALPLVSTISGATREPVQM
ncbi:MAG: lactate utilization protein [Chromatiaceae bacterium]|nr:MAG: lactate utilization protein [Chromatiaceae bacterium]